jgi:hypothetical protein
MVAAGVVGAYGGYWIGHGLGWSRQAEWPLRIGGGGGAIVLSVLTSLACVAAAGWWATWRAQHEHHRVLSGGVPASAVIIRVWRTGILVKSPGGGSLTQLGFELEVLPADARPYRVRTTKLVAGLDMVTMHPGIHVDVRYDPFHPSRVAIEDAPPTRADKLS